MLNVNQAWDWNSSFFFQYNSQIRNVFKPTNELTTFNTAVGGVLSVYALSNFLDTWNGKFSSVKNLKNFNLRDIYHILSLSTLVAPLAIITQSSIRFYTDYSSTLHSSLRGNTLYTLLGGAAIMYGVKKPSNLNTTKRIGIGVATGLATLGSMVTGSAIPLTGAIAMTYSSEILESAHNLIKNGGSIDDWLRLTKKSALSAIAAGFIYNHKWILNSISPWVQAINFSNTAAMLMFRSFDVLSGRERSSSILQSSLGIVGTIGGFVSMSAAIEIAIALVVAAKVFSFLELSNFYQKTLNYVEKGTIIFSLIRFTPQVLESIYDYIAIPTLSLNIELLPTIGIQGFANGVSLSNAFSSMFDTVDQFSPLIMPTLGSVMGSYILYKGYTSYRDWMSSNYADPKHILYDPTGTRKFKLTDLLMNALSINRNFDKMERKGGLYLITGTAAIALSYGAGVVLCYSSLVILYPYLAPLSTHVAVFTASLLLSSKSTYLPSILTVGGAGVVLGGMKGMFEGNIIQSSIKFGSLGGGVVLLSSYFGIGGSAGRMAIGVLASAAPYLLGFSVGALPALIILSNAWNYAYQQKQPEYSLVAEKLLSDIDHIKEKLLNLLHQLPDFPIGSLNKGVEYAEQLKRKFNHAGQQNFSARTNDSEEKINRFINSFRNLAEEIFQSYKFTEPRREKLINANSRFKDDIEELKSNVKEKLETVDDHYKDMLNNILKLLEKCSTNMNELKESVNYRCENYR
ncbi:hypothetical protein NF27_CY00130 [Candidatus Jidaibacter acanthamoeba]|uniref:Transmembrane protein n=1 Tax=Candidatus Jidaibacter acanthamoebae TaxID=86105 RepID=A0A0C1MUK2_9RICK|nr:hypothetical protein [Candidatus Jidaibacter acanthamoeba]KIE05777.1 hypothetical protein NF27_CY00130 [Candidatus Jidaibacter acanthamoeba]